DKTLSSTTSRSNPRAGRSREAEALGHARLPSTVDRGARADWTLSRAQHNIHAKSHLRKHSGLFSRPVIILPEPGAVVRFASCNTCDERGDRRQQGGHFWRPLAREGGDPPKIPRSRRPSRSKGGQDRRLVGRVLGGGLGATPELSHKPGSGGARA